MYANVLLLCDAHLEVRRIRCIPTSRTSDNRTEPDCELIGEFVDCVNGSLVVWMTSDTN